LKREVARQRPSPIRRSQPCRPLKIRKASRKTSSQRIGYSVWLRSPSTKPRASNHGPGEADDLEELAHLVFVDEPLRHRPRRQVGRRQQGRQAAVEQEARLRGVAQHVQARHPAPPARWL
jgi:hypothetical protein